MFAIISDIHSNLEALRAVLADIRQRGLDRILCLGDIVGYGPDPLDCLDLVRENCDITLCGNHDQAVLLQPNNFNVGAERACFWTRDQFELEPDAGKRDARWRFFGSLPVKHVEGKMMFVHASPRRPVNEYIFPDDVFSNPTKMAHIFERIEGVCFVGHTHVPGMFIPEPDFLEPDEFGYKTELSGERRIFNVGSVGQPRDRDSRACYVIVDEQDDTIEFIRVAYDPRVTCEKVTQVPALDNYLGLRLIEGR